MTVKQNWFIRYKYVANRCYHSRILPQYSGEDPNQDEIITSFEELAAERIAIYTKENAEVLRLSSVANTPEEEARFRGVPARAVWC